MNKRKYLLLAFLVGCTLWIFNLCVLEKNNYNSGTQPATGFNKLIDGFSSTNVDERAQAANQAGFYNQPDKATLIPYLIIALQEPDCGWDCSRVRAAAAQSVGQLGIYNKEAVNILISWLTEAGHSEDELIQAIQTINVFAKYAPDSTAGLVYIMMNPPKASPQYHQIQVAAANSLSKIGNPAAVQYLLSIILSPNEPDWVRKSMSIALARYGTSATCAVPYLISMLDSTTPDLRIGSAVVISQATGNKFPNSEPENWDPDLLGPWKFEMQANGEYSIVAVSKNWWQEEGIFKTWSKCDKGPKGESVLP
jgi:HEAT repeat protein